MRRIVFFLIFAIGIANAAAVVATVRTSAGLTVNGATVPVGVPAVLVTATTKIATGAAPTTLTSTSGATAVVPAATVTSAAPVLSNVSEEPPPIFLGPPTPVVSFYRRTR